MRPYAIAQGTCQRVGRHSRAV